LAWEKRKKGKFLLPPRHGEGEKDKSINRFKKKKEERGGGRNTIALI